MPLFFLLLTNDHYQGDFLNKLYILSTFSNISLSFHEVHLIEGRSWTTLLNHEQLLDVDQNLLARALKNLFSPSSAFLSLYNEQTRNFFLSWKQLWANLIGSFQFDIAHSKILLTDCADQLFYNLKVH